MTDLFKSSRQLNQSKLTVVSKSWYFMSHHIILVSQPSFPRDRILLIFLKFQHICRSLFGGLLYTLFSLHRSITFLHPTFTFLHIFLTASQSLQHSWSQRPAVATPAPTRLHRWLLVAKPTAPTLTPLATSLFTMPVRFLETHEPALLHFFIAIAQLARHSSMIKLHFSLHSCSVALHIPMLFLGSRDSRSKALGVLEFWILGSWALRFLCGLLTLVVCPWDCSLGLGGLDPAISLIFPDGLLEILLLRERARFALFCNAISSR